MERVFRGVWIPSAIYLDNEITPTEKFLLAEIESLDLGSGCDADNGYLAKFCKCDERSVRRFLSHLRENGYIEIELSDGSRIIHRRATETVTTMIGKERFITPTLEEVKAYCNERGDRIEAERFYDYYSARGWFIEKGVKMVDWKACVRAWERYPEKKPPGRKEKDVGQHDYMLHGYSEEKLKSAVVDFTKWGDKDDNT